MLPTPLAEEFGYPSPFERPFFFNQWVGDVVKRGAPVSVCACTRTCTCTCTTRQPGEKNPRQLKKRQLERCNWKSGHAKVAPSRTGKPGGAVKRVPGKAQWMRGGWVWEVAAGRGRCVWMPAGSWGGWPSGGLSGLQNKHPRTQGRFWGEWLVGSQPVISRRR